MGYAHILNLYKDDRIFSYNECFALEKIHGTSAHVTVKIVEGMPEVHYMSGGESYENFKALFREGELYTGLMTHFAPSSTKFQKITFFGEAYGGKCQGMSATYGKALKFVVFDVNLDGMFLSRNRSQKNLASNLSITRGSPRNSQISTQKEQNLLRKRVAMESRNRKSARVLCCDP